MGKKKYVAYVGTYTHGTGKGIQVYDVNVEEGTLTERSEVQVSNASYTAVSKNGKFLYSIEDEGVAVFQRDENGDLTRINSVDIDGMRGCFLATDVDGRYLYVAGYQWYIPIRMEALAVLWMGFSIQALAVLRSVISGRM